MQLSMQRRRHKLDDDFGIGGHMHYNPGRHHGEPNEGGFLRHTDDEPKLLFDSMEAAAQPRSEREVQRAMDGLLRECLKRKRLIP
jgi:hypothetical protein